MNFTKWLLMMVTLMTMVAFTALSLLMGRWSGVSLCIALSIALLYGIITIVIEVLWRRYNNRR